MIKNVSFLLMMFLSATLMTGCHHQHKDVIGLFPMDNYDQTIADWIKPSNENYDKPLFNNADLQKHLSNFYKHYIGEASPWNEKYINHLLSEAKSDGIKNNELDLIRTYSNANKSGNDIAYGENYRPYAQNWIDSIINNIDFSQMINLHYNMNNRAIAIDNLYARALPTDDPLFYSYKVPGQGYPFDNLQISAVWVGTPVYILTETRNHAWSLIATSDYIGWVKTTGLARASDTFIKTWQTAALKHLAAITHTKTSIIDSNGIYRFTAYVGSVFPQEETKLMIPVTDEKHQAVVAYASVAQSDAALIPLAATPHNFSIIMNTLIGRPYGWGNLYFYNDCSSELKNLFTPFGVWLPRHSSDQIYAGKMTDLSKLSTKDRLRYLMKNGHAFTTLIYVDNHIILFIGNYANANSKEHELIPMTFQEKWGLRPKLNTRRAIIGKSIIFPLLEQYPEDPNLMSQAGEKYFQISQLTDTPNYIEKLEIINLKDLMH